MAWLPGHGECCAAIGVAARRGREPNGVGGVLWPL